MSALNQWLEGRSFYELMYAYRHAPLVPLSEAAARFEEVKACIRAAAVTPEPPTEGELKPCGRIASATHCCEYHAVHSDDDFVALQADLRSLWRIADRQLASLAESGIVVPELAAELERLRERGK